MTKKTQTSPAPIYNVSIKCEDLPALSTVAIRALRIVDDDRADARVLAEVIESDAAMTTRLLRLASSPVFGSLAGVTRIDQALVRLGAREVKCAIIAVAAGDLFEKDHPYLGELWRHSVATAIAAGWLSRRLAVGAPEECVVAGLMHDIGKLLIHEHYPELYIGALAEARRKHTRFYKCERDRIFFSTHETVGAMATTAWGLNPRIVQVVRFHHDIEEDAELCRRADPIAPIVALGNLLADTFGYGSEKLPMEHVVESIVTAHLGLDEKEIDEIARTLPHVIENRLSVF